MQTFNDFQALTEAIKGLIAEFEDDADAQLAAFEKNYDEFAALAAGLPGESPFAAQEERLAATLRALMPSGIQAEEWRLIEEQTRAVMAGRLPRKALETISARLYEAHGARPGNGRDPIKTLAEEVKVLALKHHRHLEKLRAEHRDAVRVVDYFRT